MSAHEIITKLDELADPTRAAHSQRFFKTGEGEYGHGDVFLGLTVPQMRKIVKPYTSLKLGELSSLLDSPVHEHRFSALVILVNKAKKAKGDELKQLYDFYLAHTKHINNWDLVDISCRDVIGKYLLDKPKNPLYQLARSKNMWERRIAMVSTWWFIREGELDDTFKLAKELLKDKEDLMHKAVGWMLREAGKKDELRLREFLDDHAATMPRTMLRYAIEKFPDHDRKAYLKQS